ncbi:MAG: iron-containing alcohol dehydrogenase [Desulfobacteraceae bacterium]|nr:iron-containing alcohol dehydrogenase [Desulfobacteraceae bacterium]
MIWTIKKAIYRAMHGSLKVMMVLFNLPEPELFTGAGSSLKIPEVVKSKGINNVLVVTDKVLMELNLLEGLFNSLKENNVEYKVFDDVSENPTIQNVEDGLKLYLEGKCAGIIAFGGGSPMDCAKAIGARAVNPKRSVLVMKGLFKVRRKIPPLFTIPTTAGTGSETTIAAVIKDPDTHEKFAIVDMKLIPIVAALDPELMVGLPPHITSSTGMDALTHAVEAYIGVCGNKLTNENAEKATKLIFENLEEVYKDGLNLEKRNNMALASYYAGVAFTRAGVGYVHAIAHNMGGLYGVPHGLANAVILPYILEFSRKDAEEKLAGLAIAGGIGTPIESNEELSYRFIEKVKAMNKNMGIPSSIKEIQIKDIPLIAERAVKEGNPDYPVPKIMNQKECEDIIRKLLP